MKKSLLFSILLLTAAGAFAQLSVKPNGTTDSYVYVKNQILYVEDYIDLEKNNPGTEEASIYLRDGGQLIQENPLALNSGNGQLSVQQTTDPTNAYAYYYWCSPIGNPVAGPQNTGNQNFGVSHLYEPDPTISPTAAIIAGTTPTRNGTADPMIISTRWLYTHKNPGTEAAGDYQRMNGGNNAPPGFGFTMKGLGEILEPEQLKQTYEFRGRPNNGSFTIPVETGLMTLTGNPYPSALDLNKLYYDTDAPGNGALSAIWYYDEDRTVDSQHLYTGKPFGYGTWVPVDPTNDIGAYVKATFYIWKADGTHNGGGGSTPSTRPNPKRYAPIGQGFMFVGRSDGNVTIKNSHRAFVKEGETGGSIFFRPITDNTSDEETTTQNDAGGNLDRDINASDVDTRTPQLRLYVVFDDALTRDMLLLFSDETSDGYDRGYDGLSPGGMKTDAFFPIEDNNETLPYVIQGTNYDNEKQIPITFKLNKQSKIEVRAVEEINKPYQKAYLFDKQEDTYRALTKDVLASSSFTLPAGTYEDRFYIVFRNPNLRSDIPEEELLAKEAVTKSVNFFQNNPAHQLEVSNPYGYTLKSAAVYDMAGKLVINEKNLGDDTKYSFYTGNLSDGVYLIKLTTSEDIIIDYKAIVHNK